MINYEERLIFFHIPKTAGLSVGRFFGTYVENKTDHRTIYEVLPLKVFISNYLQCLDGYLLKCFFRNLILKRNRISLNDFVSFSKIAVVRNPYSRLVSWYLNVMKDPYHLKRHGGVKISFDEFVEKYLDSSWGCRTQLDWIRTKDDLYSVDHIIKYENLINDIENVCSIIDFNESMKLPTFHKGDKYDWKDYYRNNIIVRKVTLKYQLEFEAFGYETLSI